MEILELIHVTKNIVFVYFYYIGPLFFSNQSVSTLLLVIRNNSCRSLYR